MSKDGENESGRYGGSVEEEQVDMLDVLLN